MKITVCEDMVWHLVCVRQYGSTKDTLLLGEYLQILDIVKYLD